MASAAVDCPQDSDGEGSVCSLGGDSYPFCGGRADALSHLPPILGLFSSSQRDRDVLSARPVELRAGDDGAALQWDVRDLLVAGVAEVEQTQIRAHLTTFRAIGIKWTIA